MRARPPFAAAFLATLIAGLAPAAAQQDPAIILTDEAIGPRAYATPAPKAAPAAPAAQTRSSLNAASLAAALRRAGYEAEIKPARAGGDEYVMARGAGGQFQALLGQCAQGRCSAVQLYTGLAVNPKPSLATINAWNAKARFAHAYLDAEGDPVLQMDLDLDGGVTDASLDAAFKRWGRALEGFLARIEAGGG